MKTTIKKIGVFTSGGDAPGMNASLRAVVRTACFHNIEVVGIKCGYEGMINGDFRPLEKRDVGNIIQRGGTFLKTARSKEFMTEKGRAKAFKHLKKHKIEALIALGGNGTFTGAEIFHKEFDLPIVGVPCTIDNDLYGTDKTIGFDTAVNTAVEAVDKIRDTAESHNRLFFVEVMGRHAGFIALHTAIASGAGSVILPEKETTIDELVKHYAAVAKSKRMTSLVIVAEGNPLGSADEIAKKVEKRLDVFDVRVTVIGHLQRGGSPSAYDRVLASRLGFSAVNALLEGHQDIMVGVDNDQIKYTPFKYAINNQKDLNLRLIRLAEILAI
ncbi:MAG TPA: 6-phosphofructokinase [Bacteroidetes bacterium]|nr:6-phosphofructokinase [Bacteroidota bacterium]